jgi:hypothetical protein
MCLPANKPRTSRHRPSSRTRVQGSSHARQLSAGTHVCRISFRPCAFAAVVTRRDATAGLCHRGAARPRAQPLTECVLPVGLQIAEVASEKSRRAAWEDGYRRWRALRTQHAIDSFTQRIRCDPPGWKTRTCAATRVVYMHKAVASHVGASTDFGRPSSPGSWPSASIGLVSCTTPAGPRHSQPFHPVARNVRSLTLRIPAHLSLLRLPSSPEFSEPPERLAAFAALRERQTAATSALLGHWTRTESLVRVAVLSADVSCAWAWAGHAWSLLLVHKGLAGSSHWLRCRLECVESCCGGRGVLCGRPYRCRPTCPASEWPPGRQRRRPWRRRGPRCAPGRVWVCSMRSQGPALLGTGRASRHAARASLDPLVTILLGLLSHALA